jgi:hypothetical protein
MKSSCERLCWPVSSIWKSLELSASEPVGVAVADEEVGAAVAVEAVAAGVAAEHVVAEAAEDRVVARTGEEHVVAGEEVHESPSAGCRSARCCRWCC